MDEGLSSNSVRLVRVRAFPWNTRTQLTVTRHNPMWIFEGLFVLFSVPLITALFIFNHRAADLGYTPHTHRAYGWSVCNFTSYWHTFLLFAGRYDTFGCLLFTLSAVATAMLLNVERPASWTRISPPCYYWSLGALAFLMMAGFIAWEQYVNPEPMFELLMPPPPAAVVFPIPPEAVIEVRHDAFEAASPIEKNVEFTAAKIATKKREEKLGLFKNNGRGVISPTLFGSHRVLGYLGVAFCSAFVLAVGNGLDLKSWPSQSAENLSAKDVFKDMNLFMPCVSGLLDSWTLFC